MDKRRSFWGLVGDGFMKLLAVWMVVLACFSAVQTVRSINSFTQIYPLWIGWGLIGTSVGILFFVIIPLAVGLWLRRRWARILWIVVLVAGLLIPLKNYWFYGPFSPKNSLPVVIISLLVSVLLLWLTFSPLFRRYMNRDGGGLWLWVGVSGLLVVQLFFFIFFMYLNRALRDLSRGEVVSLPDARLEERLPAGWSETPLYGFMIPIPAGTTNDFSVDQEGVEINSFANKNEGHVYPVTFMTDPIALYTCWSNSFGVDSLERNFRYRHQLRLHPSLMLRRTIPEDTTHAGFFIGEAFDLMFELQKNGLCQFILVDLELKPSKKYYSCILRLVEPLSLEEQLLLISRIRPIDGADPNPTNASAEVDSKK